MMLAILKKDLRAGWFWVLVMTIILSTYYLLNLATWPAEFSLGRLVRPFGMIGVIDVDTRFPLVRFTESAWLAMIFGIGFGLWHCLPDVGGASGFFFSRPCSRQRLAIGKLLAGTVMFWLPGLIATACAVAWVLSFNLSAPFEWWMALAPLVFWLMGYMFYLAAFATAWRQARWYGGRLLPLVLPLPIGFFMTEVAPTMELAWLIGGIYVVVLWIINVYLLVRWEG